MLVEAAALAVVAVYLAGTVVLAVYGTNCYVMIWLFCRGQRRQREADALLLERFDRREVDIELPFVTTQLPVYNERWVVERLLDAVAAFDYPRARHEIQVLDDSTDDTSALVALQVGRLKAEGHSIQHLRRADREGFKAGALQAGLAQARGELVAIFDADFLPPPDFLRRTVPFLVEDSSCGFVQARWGHQNRDHSALTAAQAIGIDGHFVVEQSARAWNGLFLNFNGTAGVWRRQAIEDAGGWSADTLTEDLALSYRAQLKGWRGRFLLDLVTPAELPSDINAFKSQQYRWAKGSIQTALRLLPTLLRRREVGLFQRAQAALHLTHYLVHPVMLAMALLLVPLVLALGTGQVPRGLMFPALACMLVSLFAPSALYLFSQRVAGPGRPVKLSHLVTLMALGLGLAVNNTRGVLSALFGRDPGEFVRTPKRGASGTGGYRAARTQTWLLELLLGVWSSVGFIVYLHQDKLFVGPLLALHAAGYFGVGTLSLYHLVRPNRPTAAAGRQGQGADPEGTGPRGAPALSQAGPAGMRTPSAPLIPFVR